MPRRTLLVAGGCLLATWLLYLAAVHTAPGRTADERARLGAVRGLAWFEDLGELLRAGTPVVLALLVAVLAVVALTRGRWRTVAVCAVLTVVATGIARALRLALPPPPAGSGLDGGQVVNTFPSGHVAAAAVLLACLLLLWPGRTGPAVLVVTGVVLVATALGSVVNHAHRPSDVLGSLLLVAALGTLARATAARWERAALSARPRPSG